MRIQYYALLMLGVLLLGAYFIEAYVGLAPGTAEPSEKWALLSTATLCFLCGILGGITHAIMDAAEMIRDAIKELRGGNPEAK